MTTLQLTHSNNLQVVDSVAACLGAGGVVVVPTETVYGLITRWGNVAGRERIYAMKVRDERKPLQMLACGASPEHLGREMVDDERVSRLVERFCPGPLTIVVQGRAGTLGLRIPDSAFILDVIRKLGHPLAATSANLSGSPAALTASEAVADLQGQPDLLVDGGNIVNGRASTVVSLLENKIRLIRPGPIDFEVIRNALMTD